MGAVQKLTGGDVNVEFTLKEITAFILEEYPDFKRSTVSGQIGVGCPNHGSHAYHAGNYKYYWKVGTRKYRLYDPDRNKVESDG